MILRKFCDNLDILAHIFENTLIFCPSGYIYISEGRNQATSVQRQDIRIYASSDLKTSSDLPYHHPSQLILPTENFLHFKRLTRTVRRARQEVEARTWDVFPNTETQR